MSFLKAITIVTLWMILSFVWVSMGQSKGKECSDYGEMENWLKSYPVVDDWYHFYVDQNSCEAKPEEFLKVLSSSEPLSTKLNQVKVKFDQFYVPLSRLLSIQWSKVDEKELQNIQSDLTLLDNSLKRVLQPMTPADGDYLRAVILLGLPSEFAKNNPLEDPRIHLISGRINQGIKRLASPHLRVVALPSLRGPAFTTILLSWH